MTSMTSITSMTSSDDMIPMDIDHDPVGTSAAHPLVTSADSPAHKFQPYSQEEIQEIQKVSASCSRKNAIACRNKNYPLLKFLLQRDLTGKIRESTLRMYM